MITYEDIGIKKVIDDRISQIDDEVIEYDDEYKEIGERADELLKRVTAKLAPEDKNLVKQYDDIWLELLCRRSELLYSGALMDITYWVLMVGRGIEKITV